VAKQLVQLNNTSRTEYVFIQDSSSTTGAGLTGLTYLSAGLSLTYVVERGTAGSLGLALLASASAAWASGGFVAVDAALMPGVYRLDIPNVVFATADKAVVMLKGATNMAPVVLEYQIVGFNPDDAVRLGLTAIPNVAQGTTGSLPTGNATGQVTVATNNDKTGYALSGTQTFNVTGNITGNLSGSVGSIGTGGITSGSFATDSITATAIAADAITSSELATSAIDEIADGFLNRNIGGGSSTGRVVKDAFRAIRNKSVIATSTLTVYQEDDTTSAWTATVGSDPTAEPIISIDPA
jgi:hypothetical protein